jgi:DNA-binding NarL/FixJ family response regulator
MSQLRDELPEAKVIAMDILPEQVDMIEFVQAGGAGFILKSAPMDDYIKTIKLVAGGTNVLPPVLTTSLFTQIVDSLLKSGGRIPDDAVKLTSREKEIVDLISEGLSNKEIAKRLHIATYTVKSHVHNILEKLALSTRLEIAAFARKDRPK